MLVRVVERTTNYKKQAKKLSIDQELEEKIDAWAKSFTFVHSERSDMIFRSPRKKVEIWDIRLPNPSKKRGTSGGFRMLCFYILEEQAMFLDYIVERNSLNRGKEKQEYYNYQKSLKSSLSKNYDPR